MRIGGSTGLKSFYNCCMRSLYPKQPGDFARWLAQNCRASEIWLVFYKNTSGRQTVAYKHALQDALCYGVVRQPRKKHRPREVHGAFHAPQTRKPLE